MFKRKEKQLRQRELRLKQYEAATNMTMPNRMQPVDPKARFEAIKVKYDQQLDTIREDVKSKIRENKRLYNAFKSIRDSNESLRVKVYYTLSTVMCVLSVLIS